MTPGQLTYQLSAAGKNKDWAQVLELFNMLQTYFPDFYDPWSQYWYARALIETGDYVKGIEMIATTHKQNPVFAANNSLFDYALKKFAEDFDPYTADERELNHILNLVETESDPDTIINFKIKLAKKFREKNQIYDALNLLERIDIQQVNTQRRETPRGKVLSLAESLALELSNLYLKTNQPHKAEKIINYIFKRIEQLDKNAEKFLRDRLAQALIQQGKYEQALQMLGPLLQFDEWIWYYRIAEVLLTIGQEAPAFYFTLQAALNRKQHPWFKNKVYLFLLRHFLDRFTREQARTIASFLVQLYADHGYINSKTPQKLIKYFKIDENGLPGFKSLAKSTNKILQEHKCSKKLKGKVIKIDHAHNFGFIKTKDGSSFFFKRKEVLGTWDEIKKGSFVKFCLGWGFDNKKSEIKKVAINVKVL